jgi:hypothetical protein
MRKRTGQDFYVLTSTFRVELPGIEPGAKIELTRGNTGFDDAKVRKIMRNHLHKRARC